MMFRDDTTMSLLPVNWRWRMTVAHCSSRMPRGGRDTVVPFLTYSSAGWMRQDVGYAHDGASTPGHRLQRRWNHRGAGVHDGGYQLGGMWVWGDPSSDRSQAARLEIDKLFLTHMREDIDVLYHRDLVNMRPPKKNKWVNRKAQGMKNRSVAMRAAASRANRRALALVFYQAVRMFGKSAWLSPEPSKPIIVP